MFCPHCGKQIENTARFCSFCGGSIATTVTPRQTRILRPRSPRMIAGVCAGIALHFGWDIALVRVLTVVFTVITSGVGLLLYAAGWILMPEALYALDGETSRGTTA